MSVSIIYFNNNLYIEYTTKLSNQVYVDSKPAYYNFVEKTPMLNKQDILNLFK
ncbi:Glutathione-dependent formaldehyde-activating,GFA (fragment) [Xenorhabdus bovienii str. kraussei Becker Underwood]|uniref:Glutathione-dependent formaldehyde-activating,GFA n=1 Tax=Xenorhabdus bovienii str. kraussei Becker Underwood TaxID=1398204 RepID=A0A077PZX3_XENBV